MTKTNTATATMNAASETLDQRLSRIERIERRSENLEYDEDLYQWCKSLRFRKSEWEEQEEPHYRSITDDRFPWDYDYE